MIPVLFGESETSFTTLGYGTLTDAISAKVYRVLNGKDELIMTYPVSGVRFDDLQKLRIIYAVPEYKKDPQPYRIYRITTPLNGIVTVYARHVSEQKNFIPVSPFTANSISAALDGIENHTLETSPFTFWTDKTTSGSFNLDHPASVGNVLGGMEGSILDTYGGEFEFDKWTVKIWNRRGTDRGVTVRYGKNLTKFIKDESVDTTITGVLPYYIDVDDNLITINPPIIESQYADNFPFRRTIVKDFTDQFETIPTSAQLLSKATQWLNNQKPGESELRFEISFEQLSQYPEYKDIGLLETVNLGDSVNVVYEQYNVNSTARIVSTIYNCLLDKYDSIEVGGVRASFTDTVRFIDDGVEKKLENTGSMMDQKVREATEKITGIHGGHVVISTDANGEPYEILIMDTDDISTATNVLRMNMNGIGFSSTGYNGTYRTAWTLDGNFVADFITAGTMLANRIKGGTLSLGGSSNSNGTIYLYDADGTEIVRMTSGGLSLYWDVTCDHATSSGTSRVTIPTRLRFLNSHTATYLDNKQKVILSHFPFVFKDSSQINLSTYIPSIGDESTDEGVKHSPLYLNLSQDCTGFRILGSQGSNYTKCIPFEVFDNSADAPFTVVENQPTDPKYAVNIPVLFLGDRLYKIESTFKQMTGTTGTVKQILISRTDGGEATMSCNVIRVYTIGRTGTSAVSAIGKWTFAQDVALKYTENNLTTYNTLTCGKITAKDNSTIDGTLGIGGNTTIAGTLQLKYTESGLTTYYNFTGNNVRAYGNMTVSGTKSREVNAKQYGNRLLYSYETPSPVFGDIGEGIIGEDGLCYVWFDPIFLEAITATGYQVFLQKYGEGDCYVSERNQNYFVVSGTIGLNFGWEVKAKQKDFDQRRFDSFYEEPEIEEIDYGAEAVNHLIEVRGGIQE